MKIAVLTGGGDCPGLNPAIRAIVKYGVKRYGHKLIGIKYGWGGFVPEAMPSRERATLDPEEIENLAARTMELTPENVSGILTKGGTILGSSRANPIKQEKGFDLLRQRFDELNLDAVIAIGGEDTLTVAYEAFSQVRIPVVGIPKTIDNDVFGTDTTIGFATAYEIMTDAVDRLHSTAESHHMIHILEVMGRRAGWIALRAGIAGGADIILIPEFPLTLDETCAYIEERRKHGKKFSIIVVAEGYPLSSGLVIQSEQKDPFGHEQLGGVGNRLANLLKEKTGFDVRVTNPAYMQRGGPAAPFDRWIATRLGIRAVDLVHNRQFGRMAAVARNEIVDVELREIAIGSRLIPQELFEELRWLFG
ncbi:MAG: hypothetical protein A3I38_02070 [Candidatus Wildermuthbacteria bacterium RIFCSPLOWO2_02_FULL_47_10]|nr:MAG: hypothetical protein A3I38_02070 [Candidatus Wildermuthbacteria bacterium RIFCSPLOWO2_02_FULL_47_10]